MTERKTYECDVCHALYTNELDAKACEESHVDLKGVQSIRYKGHMEEYPTYIRVEFADGSIHQYRYEQPFGRSY